MLDFVELSSFHQNNLSRSYGWSTTLPQHTVSTYHPASLQSLDSRVAESGQDGRHGVEVLQIVAVLQGSRRGSGGVGQQWGGAVEGVGAYSTVQWSGTSSTLLWTSL